VVRITHDLARSIEGEDVLLVEDIVDTGLTVRYLLDNLATRHPRSLKIASLLVKPARARVPVAVDFAGFTIEDKFVVGYGLDYDGRLRNLPHVALLHPGAP
jgi:hypoxanthine phosphoribosyltransferase